MQRTNINELRQKIGEQVLVNAWVEVRRDQGKMIFMDLRDRSGMVQSVVLPMHKEALTVAQQIRSEWVLAITAQVNKRPDKNIKQDVPNGDIELEVLSIEVLNQSTTPPFDIKEGGQFYHRGYRYEPFIGSG
jgi:aspartyl-tRNA synthetase